MKLAAFGVATALMAGAWSPPHSADSSAVAQKLGAELTRVEKGAANAGDTAKTILTLAQRSRKALDASRLYLALDDMQDAWTIESGMTFRANQKITTDA